MFIISTLKTKILFWHKSGTSTSIRSTVDIKPVVESDSPTFDNATSLPLSSKTRKLRIFSTLTRFKKTSLSSVFKKDHPIQTPSTELPCTTSATQEPSSHIPDVLGDGSFPIVYPPTDHWECGADFGLISSMNEFSNREDSLLEPDPPGRRTAVRVASLRMRTAAVWASIPSTMDVVPASCEYSETSTPVKSQMKSLECDETTSIDHAMMYSPSPSSPATSVTAVSDCGLGDSLAKMGMGHEQGWSSVTPKALVAAALGDISLTQPPEFPSFVAKRPPEHRRVIEGKTSYNSSISLASGCGSFSDVLSGSSEKCADQRAASPVIQLSTNSCEDLTTSSIRGSVSLFQRPLVTELPLRTWSCAKITRAKTKRASRKGLLDKRDFFTRMFHILEVDPQKRLSVSFEAYARVA